VYRKNKAAEERKEARRRLLLDAATRLFGKHGYHATTVPMIVAEASSSTGSFYMYFENKEDVFSAALEELGQAVLGMMAQVRASEPDPLKRISLVLEELFLHFARNPEQARILIVESSGLSPRLELTRREILRQATEEVRRAFEGESSAFEVENSLIAAQCTVGATFEALCCWLEEDPEMRVPATDIARSVARFTARAIEKGRAES
jgi:AcrR family transcriptional regulator